MDKKYVLYLSERVDGTPVDPVTPAACGGEWGRRAGSVPTADQTSGPHALFLAGHSAKQQVVATWARQAITTTRTRRAGILLRRHAGVWEHEHKDGDLTLGTDSPPRARQTQSSQVGQLQGETGDGETSEAAFPLWNVGLVELS